MLKFFKYAGLALALFVVAVVAKTLTYTAPQTTASDRDLPSVDANAVAQKLSKAIQFKTLSHPLGEPGRPADFQAFLDWVPQAFPSFTNATTVDTVSGFTPIFRWAGSDPAKLPVLISGHYDVVPVESEWDVDPFAGVIKDGFVWGRGALDMKGGVITILEALDRLAASGFQPKGDVYVALTQDEEIGGLGGAQAVVKYFKDKNIPIGWSLDEGSFVLRNIVSSVDKDLAMINVAEKGYLTVEITATAEGGHSSLPPRDTATAKLAEALKNLHDNPIPGGLTGVSADFFDTLGRHMGLGERVLFANKWAFRPVIESVLSGSNSTDALLRTTTATTMLKGSETENVLPQRATATVNFRLHPRDTEQMILDHLDAVVGSEDIEITVLSSRPASPVSAHDTPAYEALANAATAVFDDVAVIPGLMVAGSDSQHYSQYVGDSYRFLPFIFTDDDLPLLHGRHERISIENLGRAVQYYMLVFETL